jgi:hypothetical protein
MVRQTSIDTFYQIKEEGLLSRVRFLIYSELFQHGPLTAQEMFKRLSLESNQSGRFTELRDLGVICEVGQRACRITGRYVIEWDVTSNLPVPPKKKTRTEKLEAALQRYADEDRCRCELDYWCRYCEAIAVLGSAPQLAPPPERDLLAELMR